MITRSLVGGEPRVNLARPGQDAPLHVVEPVEAQRREVAARRARPEPRLAVHQQIDVAGQPVGRRLDIAVGTERVGEGQLADLRLLRQPDVQDVGRPARP